MTVDTEADTALKDLVNALQRSSQQIEDLLASNARIEKRLNALENWTQLKDLGELARLCTIDHDANIDYRFIDSVDFVDKVFEVEKINKSDLFKHLVSAKDGTDTSGERALPLVSVSIGSGNYQKMLKRYFFAGKIFCEGKKVLDSCSGAGWGTFILSQYARKIISYDREPQMIEHCKQSWNTNKVAWVVDDALAPKDHLGTDFDVITSMEAIEHFTEEEGREYIYNHQNVLKSGGVFILSSLFPYTDEQARTSPVLKMEGHKYLWTREKIKMELEKYFSKVKVMSSWIVMAQK
ncbi:MAG: class I SAM-dependent methyltransferase [Pseudomonadota bacterium]